MFSPGARIQGVAIDAHGSAVLLFHLIKYFEKIFPISLLDTFFPEVAQYLIVQEVSYDEYTGVFTLATTNNVSMNILVRGVILHVCKTTPER